MSRVVCVSNRVSIPTGSGSAGGLAVGLRAAFKGMGGGGLWFGWNGELVSSFEERDTQGPAITEKDGVTYVTIPLTNAEYDRYYKGMANSGLWPLMHELTDNIDEDGTSFQGYMDVNNLFAKQLAPHLKPDDVIWVHDYHMMPLARSLKAIGVTNKVLYFHHIPIPSKRATDFPGVPPELKAHYQRLIECLFDYDQVGLQSLRDLGHLKDYIGDRSDLPERFDTATLDFGGRKTQFGAFPISIETREIAEIVASNITSDRVKRLKKDLGDRKLVISADRLDYTKGFLQRLNAVSKFLGCNLDWVANQSIQFLNIMPLSRDDIEQYKRMISQVQTSIAVINGTHGDEFWKPINFTEKNVPRDTLMAYYRLAAVGLVTSTMDGQHLGAKEYLAAQDPDDPGVLVLSKGTGASEQLGEQGALLIDPEDDKETARTIYNALNMPLDERQRRHTSLINHLRAYDVTHWARTFLERHI